MEEGVSRLPEVEIDHVVFSRELRQDVNSLPKTRPETAQDTGLRFIRAAGRLAKLEEAVVKQQREKTEENQPSRNCFLEKSLSKKSK